MEGSRHRRRVRGAGRLRTAGRRKHVAAGASASSLAPEEAGRPRRDGVKCAVRPPNIGSCQTSPRTAASIASLDEAFGIRGLDDHITRTERSEPANLPLGTCAVRVRRRCRHSDHDRAAAAMKSATAQGQTRRHRAPRPNSNVSVVDLSTIVTTRHGRIIGLRPRPTSAQGHPGIRHGATGIDRFRGNSIPRSRCRIQVMGSDFVKVLAW